MTLVIRLDVSIWDETYLRFGFLVLHIRNHSRPLPQYEDLMLLVSHCLTQYEAVRHLVCLPLPQYEVHLPRHEISSQFQGSSRWCLITSVAKFLAALYAFVAAACSGSSSLNVFSNSRGFISLSSTHGVSLLSYLCVMFAFIYVCVIRFAFDAAVYLGTTRLSSGGHGVPWIPRGSEFESAPAHHTRFPQRIATGRTGHFIR
ncbi:hypothetical protein F2Q68_00022544 [Brassica cretica]|uniref:Uncharacterized protein n=1 Tax=Brassica cretica TaxID=69181 RepID=A0A8S9G3I3_BRACR|nr:hypothetical protein F2Q68_00022544 [Brassica cretica]